MQIQSARHVIFFAVIIVGIARLASADCTAIIRPATADEKKAYAEAWALFQRAAPPAPAGWVLHDSATDDVLKDVCADPGQRLSQWTFSRSYERTEGIEARRAEEQRKIEAMAKNLEALQKANEAKLAAIQQQIDVATKKMQALVAAKKYADSEAVSQEIAGLTEQQIKLMSYDGQDAELKKISAEAARDTHANFSLSVGVTDLSTSGYSAMTVPEGKGYRRAQESGGNPRVNLMVVLSPTTGTRVGQTVARVDGDPARAEALLKAAKLR